MSYSHLFSLGEASGLTCPVVRLLAPFPWTSETEGKTPHLSLERLSLNLHSELKLDSAYLKLCLSLEDIFGTQEHGNELFPWLHRHSFPIPRSLTAAQGTFRNFRRSLPTGSDGLDTCGMSSYPSKSQFTLKLCN